MKNLNLPIFRAKEIDSDNYIEGNLRKILTADGYVIQIEGIENIASIGINQGLYRIDPATLEISDGKKWRKLSECNFRTDHEMDMHPYNGYCDGWNNYLEKNGKHPSIVHKLINFK